MAYETTLTDARQSVWNAIDNWPDLNEYFKGRLRWEGKDSGFTNEEPAFADLPLIEILPTRSVPKWFVNTKQQWTYFLVIHVWTLDWNVSQAEEVYCKIARAIARAAPDGSSAPYTASYQPVFGPMGMPERKFLDTNKIRVMKTTMELALRPQFQPFA